MDNKEFDDIIKKKLESLNSGGSDAGWDTLRQKWEQSSMTDSPEINASQDLENKAEEVDKLFDAKLKHNLTSLRMPFNSAHWVRLKAQLESEALFKKRLFVAKTVEVLMLALIVVGVLNVMPIQNDIYQIPVFDVPMVAAVQVDKATAEKHQLEANKKSKEQSIVAEKVINKFTNLNVSSIFKKSVDKSSTKTVQEQKNESETIKTQTPLNPSLDFLLPFLIDTENIDKTNLDQHHDLQVQNVDNAVTSVMQEEMPLLVIPTRPLGFPDITLGANKGKSEEKSYISVAIGPKVNLVNSPFDPVYEIDPYNTLNTNFNISAKIHKELGPLELYAGLGYSKTSYEPLIIEETYKNTNQQYNQASLENIGFKTLNIPVGVKYNIVDKNNFQLYASAGVDVNLISQAEYEVYDLPASSFRGESPSSFKPSLNSGKPEVNQKALLSQKEFKKGILDSGSLRDNLYATASVGLGLIKDVSETTSLFIEPKYSHFLTSQGLGPNLDKVHAVSIDIGVRYQLN